MQAAMRATMTTALILRLRFISSFVRCSNRSGFLLLRHQAGNGTARELELHVIGLDSHDHSVVGDAHDGADDAARGLDHVTVLKLAKHLSLLALLPPHGDHHDEVEDRETDPHHDEEVRRPALLRALLLQYQTVGVHFDVCRKMPLTNCLAQTWRRGVYDRR